MPTTTLKKILDLKLWQACSPAPVTNAANMFTVNSDGASQLTYYVTSATAVYVYDPNEDAWGLLPSPALATFAAGACGRWHPAGPTGTALAGSTATTLNTATTVLGNLDAKAGQYNKVRITSGTGAGQERKIVSSTRGANAILTVDTDWSVTPDNTSVYQLMTGRIYIFGGGTLAAGSFKYWDHATQAWSGNLSITGLSATFGTDGKLTGTPSTRTGTTGFLTGTASSGSATTLVKSGATWTTNQWANYQVRILSGANAGKVSIISSNTATTLTFATMTTAIDNTSVYVIEGCDDCLYLAGNNAVTLYKYSISGNTWSTLTPGAARAGAPGAGANLTWMSNVSAADWTNESAIKNGRYLYAFRSTNILDIYDIALNTWTSTVAYGRQNETIAASGSSYEYFNDDYLYIATPAVAGAPTRYLRFDPRSPLLEGLSTNVFPSPTVATLGDKMFGVSFGDGTGSDLDYIYRLADGGTQLHRCLLW